MPTAAAAGVAAADAPIVLSRSRAEFRDAELEAAYYESLLREAGPRHMARLLYILNGLIFAAFLSGAVLTVEPTLLQRLIYTAWLFLVSAVSLVVRRSPDRWAAFVQQRRRMRVLFVVLLVCSSAVLAIDFAAEFTVAGEFRDDFDLYNCELHVTNVSFFLYTLVVLFVSGTIPFLRYWDVLRLAMLQFAGLVGVSGAFASAQQAIVVTVYALATFSMVTYYVWASHIRQRHMFLLQRRLEDENIAVKLQVERSVLPWRRNIVGAQASAQRMPWELDPAHIEWGEMVGCGSYGEVFRCSWRGSTVAVKRIQARDTTSLADFSSEIAVLAELRHPNIVLFMGLAVESEGLLLVTEFLGLGSLADLVHAPDSEEALPFSRRIALLNGAASGLLFLHACDPPILHSDLKPHNILVSSGWVAKLADFGLSGPRSAAASNIPGTLLYASPEVLRGEPAGTAHDSYSFGLCVLETLTGVAPFEEELRESDNTPLAFVVHNVLAQGLQPSTADLADTGLKSLVERCLDHDPTVRPGAKAMQDALQAKETEILMQCSMSNSLMAQESMILSSGKSRAPAPGGACSVLIDFANAEKLWQDQPDAVFEAANMLFARCKELRAEMDGRSTTRCSNIFESAFAAIGFAAAVIEDVNGRRNEVPASVRSQFFPIAAVETIGTSGILSDDELEETVAQCRPLEIAVGAQAWGQLQDAPESMMHLTLEQVAVTEPLADGAGMGLVPISVNASFTKRGGPAAPAGRGAELEDSFRLADPATLALGAPIAQCALGIVYDGKAAGEPVGVVRLGAKSLTLDMTYELSKVRLHRHPHLVRVHGMSGQPPHASLVIEEPGRPFRVALDERGIGELGEAARFEIVRHACAALRYLHGRNVVHRDVTATTVFVRDGRVGVLGVPGLSKISAAAATMTRSAAPAYLAPEVLRGEPPSAASDIFAVGVVLWEAATREHPHEGKPWAQVVAETGRGLRLLVPKGVASPVRAVIRGAFAQNADARPDADEVQSMLQEVVGREAL